MEKGYEIPFDTKVEIVSEGCAYNSKVGTLGAKDPGCLRVLENILHDMAKIRNYHDISIHKQRLRLYLFRIWRKNKLLNRSNQSINNSP